MPPITISDTSDRVKKIDIKPDKIPRVYTTSSRSSCENYNFCLRLLAPSFFFLFFSFPYFLPSSRYLFLRSRWRFLSALLPCCSFVIPVPVPPRSCYSSSLLHVILILVTLPHCYTCSSFLLTNTHRYTCSLFLLLLIVVPASHSCYCSSLLHVFLIHKSPSLLLLLPPHFPFPLPTIPPFPFIPFTHPPTPTHSLPIPQAKDPSRLKSLVYTDKPKIWIQISSLPPQCVLFLNEGEGGRKGREGGIEKERVREERENGVRSVRGK